MTRMSRRWGRHDADRDATGWRAWLDRLPVDRRDVYCTPEYTQPFRRCYGDSAELFVWEDGDNFVLVPLLRRPLPPDVAARAPGRTDLSTPYGYAGPIARDPVAVDWPAFGQAFAAYCAETGVLTEFERLHAMLSSPLAYAGDPGLRQRGETYWLDLRPPIADIERSYRKGHQQSIAKARAAGVRVRIGDPSRDLAGFHALYTEQMRRIGAARRYRMPLEFFTESFAALGESSVLLVAELDGLPVGGAMVLRGGPWLHYHFAAAERRADTDGTGTLLVSEAARIGREGGCTRFHLGGGPDGSGLQLFKRGFSGAALPFMTYEKVRDPTVYAKACPEGGMVPCYRVDPASL